MRSGFAFFGVDVSRLTDDELEAGILRVANELGASGLSVDQAAAAIRLMQNGLKTRTQVMAEQGDLNKRPTCDVCGQPATNASASVICGTDPTGSYVRMRPAFAVFGCDLHPARAETIETDEVIALP